MLVVFSSVKIYLCLLAKFSKSKFLTSKMLIVVRLCLALQYSAKGSRVLLCSNASLYIKVVKDIKLKVKDVIKITSKLKLIII